MKFAHEPAWWQFELLAGLGMLLLAAPSYIVFRFHSFFVAHEAWRNPAAFTLVTLEIVALCGLVYVIVRAVGKTNGESSSESRPNKSLERTREG